MRKYVVIKDNRVVRLGECAEISEITLSPGEIFHLTRGNFFVGDRIFLGNSDPVLPDEEYIQESGFQTWQIALASGTIGAASSAIYFFLAGG
jgi:hypothetical protein